MSQNLDRYYRGNMSFSQFNYSVNISIQNKFIFVETPKAACSSIKGTLQRLELGDPNLPRPLDILHIRDNSPLLKPTQVGDFDKIASSKKYYKFCFIRNPYKRILSAYLSKIKRKSNRNTRRIKKFLLQIESNLEENDLSNKDISFKTFVNEIVRQPVEYMDPHWRVQYNQTLQDSIEYDFVGNFETINEDLRHVVRKIAGFRAKKYIITRRKHKTDAGRKIRKYFTPEIRDLIYTKYKDDFENFGYSSTLPEISQKKANIVDINTKELLKKKDILAIDQALSEE